MGKITYLEQQKILNDLNLTEYPSINISVLRNITIEPIETSLRFHSYGLGYDSKIQFGEYDNILQDAVGKNDNLLNANTDCVLIYNYLENLSWDLARNYASLNSERESAEVERISKNIRSIIHGVRNQTNAMILWHNFNMPLYPSLGIYDFQRRDGQYQTIRRINENVADFCQSVNDCFIIDMDVLISRIGYRKFFDLRYWHIGKAPYSTEALCEIANEDFKYIRSLKGKNKKCIVLDCDNTLWGGIVGEDGMSGIKLGKTHPGSSYYEFQQEVVNLYNRGIIITICSKNNDEDVWEIIRKHPNMLVKEHHISSAQINWNDKATNIKKIATDLNIGLDSIVFIDDSEFEIELVKKALPEVEVIHLPAGRTSEYRDILAGCGFFEALTISDEDKKRGKLYREEAIRRDLQSKYDDINDFYKSLEMDVEITYADEFSVPRIAQLFQRTNQFNLTTKRYTETDVRKMLKENMTKVVYIKLSDKYGDYGIVGVCIVKLKDKDALIDSFLLSCRVIGRKVEGVFLSNILKMIRGNGYHIVIGEYCPTKKNKQVESFYVGFGFKEIVNDMNSQKKIYHFDISKISNCIDISVFNCIESKI